MIHTAYSKQSLKGDEMTNWQQIETAPKDGNWFLAWQEGMKEGRTRWWYWSPNPIVVRWWTKYIFRDDGFFDSWGHKVKGLTHWMPLPEPPK